VGELSLAAWPNSKFLPETAESVASAAQPCPQLMMQPCSLVLHTNKEEAFDGLVGQHWIVSEGTLRMFVLSCKCSGVRCWSPQGAREEGLTSVCSKRFSLQSSGQCQGALCNCSQPKQFAQYSAVGHITSEGRRAKTACASSPSWCLQAYG